MERCVAEQMRENTKQFDLLGERMGGLDTKIAELAELVRSQGALLAQHQQQIGRLQVENNALRHVLEKTGRTGSELAVAPSAEQKMFERFVRVEEARARRKELDDTATKQEILKRIWCIIWDLENIGDRNAKVWAALEKYVQIVDSMQPETSSWNVMEWWYSAQGLLSFEDLRNAVDSACGSAEHDTQRIVLRSVREWIDEAEQRQEEEKAELLKSQWNILSNAPLTPPIQAVKEVILSHLDNSGIALCKELQELIGKLDEKDPVQFLIDHCVVYVQSDRQIEDSTEFVDDPARLSMEQQEKLRQFVETFVIGDDWVHVPSDGESIKEPNIFSKTCSHVKNACSLYGYHPAIDTVIDTADEYKHTAKRVKNTIDWIYFGGRMVVDPYGAAFSLLW